MAIVYSTLALNEPLTEEELAEIAALKDRPIIIDEDCPEMTIEEMLEGIELAKQHRLEEQMAREQAKIAI